jgi:hypothetical protein
MWRDYEPKIYETEYAQMFTSLSRDLDAIDNSGCMIKLFTIFFITPLYRLPSTWNPAIGSTHPLHLVMMEWQQIKATLMSVLPSTIRD